MSIAGYLAGFDYFFLVGNRFEAFSYYWKTLKEEKGGGGEIRVEKVKKMRLNLPECATPYLPYFHRHIYWGHTD